MKYAKVIAIILVIGLLFSGCSFRLASSIDDLIFPVSPSGENADIQTALDSYVKNGYSLKTPSGGSNKTAFSFYDVNGDGVDEAFAFYEPADKLSNIDLAVIAKTDNEWKVVDNIQGNGKDIYSIDFKDINNDKKAELIICWDVISNSTSHNLTIYYSKSKLNYEVMDDYVTVNNYICVDMNNDNVDELLMFELNANTSSVAELYNVKNNKLNLLGQTKLDKYITSYTKLQIENAEDDVRVYADALGSDGTSMLTELIYWSNGYDTIISPFYSYSTGLTTATTRSAMLYCSDINNDKLIEIPTDYNIKKLPKQVLGVDWCIYKNTTLVHTDYSLFVDNDNYFIIIPDKYINKISVIYDEDNRQMTVKNSTTKKTVYSVKAVLKATYSKSKYKDYSVILDDNGYYYLAKLGNDSDIKFTVKQLKTYIKSVDMRRI